MNRRVMLFLLFLLTFLIITIPITFAAEPSLKQVIKDARRQGLCGEYIADGGIYKRFIFGDGNKVVMDASGLEVSTTYFVIGDLVFVVTDKDYLRLMVKSPSLLDGYGSWTKGYRYMRKKDPAQPCTIFAQDPAERREVKNQICYYTGVQLQGAMKFDQATEKYLNCCNSGDAVSCNKYGTLKYLMKDPKTAFKYYRKACDSGYGGGCANLADIEKRKGNIQKARQLYEEACTKQFKSACYKAAFLEVSEKDGESYFKKGYDYLRKDQNDKAISEFSEAIKIDPGYADAYLNRGIAYARKGQHDKAISDYSKAIEINPKYSRGYNNRGFAYEKKGQYDKAISDYSKAIEINPKYANAYLNRGYTYVKKGQLDQSISDLTKAIEINPKYVDAYYERGLAYYKLKHYEKAISDCSNALKIAPKLASAYNLRAICYYYKKEYKQAWNDVRAAQKLGYEPHPGFLKALRTASGKQEDSTQIIEQSRFKEWRDPVTKMGFVWISKGCFQMGSPVSETDRRKGEGPLHEVCVDGFWMGKYEVTNKQFRTFKPSHSSGAYEGFSLDKDEQPVVSVSLEEARGFAKWMSQQNGNKYTFRLPTEAEWEYACRAGTKSSWFWGDDPKKACTYANVADKTLSEYWMWPTEECSDGYLVSSPVGQFHPNQFGLYDILGNAYEWCEDDYQDDAYEKHARNNPLVKGGVSHVFRGPGWNQDPRTGRCAYRGFSTHNRGYYYLGLRLVRTQ